MRITFVDEGVFPIHSVKLIWQDPFTPAVSMQNIMSDWIAEFDDPSPGSYGYRFMINNLFTINDPTANIYQPDEDGKLWSFIIMDSDKQRLYNNEQYTVNIESVNMSNDFYEDYRREQTEFKSDLDKLAVIKYGFNNITGAHTVSVIWLDPLKRIAGWGESVITPSPTGCIYNWFGLDLSDENVSESGDYNILMFVDGKYITTNKFSVEQNTRQKVQMHYFNMQV